MSDSSIQKKASLHHEVLDRISVLATGGLGFVAALACPAP